VKDCPSLPPAEGKKGWQEGKKVIMVRKTSCENKAQKLGLARGGLGVENMGGGEATKDASL